MIVHILDINSEQSTVNLVAEYQGTGDTGTGDTGTGTDDTGQEAQDRTGQDRKRAPARVTGEQSDGFPVTH